MHHVAWLGLSPEVLSRRVHGEIWSRWTTAEPDLAPFTSLEHLRELRGLDTDPPLGALVRLAAQDGGDDTLAAIAVCHQLERGARHLMHSLRDLAEDIDEVVMAALWVQVRCFPWRRRTRAYAANLLRDTRGAVLEAVGQRRYGTDPRVVVPIDYQSPMAEWLSSPERAVSSGGRASSLDSTFELVELLDWALATGVIGRGDAALLVDLINAGEETAEQDSPWTARGMCTRAAVQLVAQRQGVCAKTVIRRRDRIVGALRESAERYLQEVA